MIKKNYHQLMEDEIRAVGKREDKAKLLLHICCAPCSSYVIEMLAGHFSLTLYFYDPNIHPLEEYEKRRDETKEHARTLGIEFIEGPYDVQRWFETTKGHEDEPEKGDRCSLCFDLRLGESAKLAKELNCDYFTSVLTVSPHKNSRIINETGFALSEMYGVRYLPSDFKKQEGFKKSMEMSRMYGFYRQDYCGCIYSKR